MLYFDSNLCLSNEYLSANNLYADPLLNVDKTKKGCFGKNGKVKAQKLRGELSNGFVAELCTLNLPSIGIAHDGELIDTLKVGQEFTHINGVEICKKYIVPNNGPGQHKSRTHGWKNKAPIISDMFKKHWDTKQFMRECQNIPSGIVYVEEKIHGTSGRTAFIEVTHFRKWYQLWKPQKWTEWNVVSGTRRVDNINGHISETRKEIHNKLAPHLHKGEILYYEIFGHDKSGKEIQPGFSYCCVGGEYKIMLYRVTITTPDGFSVDLPRESVYKRAEELGLMKPILIGKTIHNNVTTEDDLVNWIKEVVHGNSAIANHMKEGVVVWFMRTDGTWDCLKHRSEEFLLNESEQRDNNINDCEDVL